MPIYLIPENEIIFPHPLCASVEGVLGIGGDLSVERLTLAYRWGIFPWYNENEPITWWFPNPRFVLFPDELHVSKSMRKYFNSDTFEVTFDQCFEEVVNRCRHIRRKDQFGTWILPEMINAYCDFHDAGFAHSVEVWQDEKLVGGLYGVCIGKIFFGESMFSEVSNASKFGFIHLVQRLQKFGIELIDCQQETPHLRSLGAKAISAERFFDFIKSNDRLDCPSGIWPSSP